MKTKWDLKHTPLFAELNSKSIPYPVVVCSITVNTRYATKYRVYTKDKGINYSFAASEKDLWVSADDYYEKKASLLEERAAEYRAEKSCNK